MILTPKIFSKLLNLGTNKEHSSFLPNLLKHYVKRLIFYLRDEGDFHGKTIKKR